MEQAATAPPGRRGPADDDPLLRRQARRRGRARQPGRAGPRPAVREPLAVRAAARSGWASTRPSAARSRPASTRPADHPGHAGLLDRRDVRLAAGRVRLGRRRRQRRRRRAPERHLHVHGRGHPVAPSRAAVDRASGHPAHAGDGRIEVTLERARAATRRADRRLPGPLHGAGRETRSSRPKACRSSDGGRRGADERDRVPLRGRRRHRVDARARGPRAWRRRPRRRSRRRPGKPTVEALDGAVRIKRRRPTPTAAADVPLRVLARQRRDAGRARPTRPAADATTAQIGGLTNGVVYVCRAFAANDIGLSEASPLSDAVRPCSSILECNGLSTPVVAGVGGAADRRPPRGALLPAPRPGRRLHASRSSTSSTPPTSAAARTSGSGSSGPAGTSTGSSPAQGPRPTSGSSKLRGDRFKVRRPRRAGARRRRASRSWSSTRRASATSSCCGRSRARPRRRCRRSADVSRGSSSPSGPRPPVRTRRSRP